MASEISVRHRSHAALWALLELVQKFKRRLGGGHRVSHERLHGFARHHTPIYLRNGYTRFGGMRYKSAALARKSHISSNTHPAPFFREGLVMAIIRNGNCSAATRVLARASSRQ